MNYSIPITEANKSQIKNIKRLNALIKEERESIKALHEYPKTPTGRLTKDVHKCIDQKVVNIENYNEQRGEFLNALKTDIHDLIFDLSKARAVALIPLDSKFLIAVSDSIEGDGCKPISVGKSETKEFFVKASMGYDGRLNVALDDSERASMFGTFELRLSNNRGYGRHYNIQEFIESYKFQFTEYGLEFTTSITDEYGLYTHQIDDLKSSDTEMLIKLLGELNTLQTHLNRNSDLHCLAMLTNVYCYVERIFDLEIK